jgi:tRNA threonylcarbamoyladenosine biosynthesis protein TsaE
MFIEFSASLSELRLVVMQLNDMLLDSKVIVFRGEMGAGKTTLINALCKRLGVQDHTGSPTFSIVNEYRAIDGRRICHFDFYRINELREALDIGWYEYLDSDAVCLVEWPEKIETLLPDKYINVRIEPISEDRRLFVINTPVG